MKLVEPGTFLMGERKQQHQVTLTEPFLLGLYPVTQEQYRRVTGTNPSRFSGDDRRPVENVTWFHAINYCNLLSEQEGLSPYYLVNKKVTILGGEGYRLPTEAESEYACRSGNNGTYCFGENVGQLADYAWYMENSQGTTHPVGEKQPNAFGLYDMHGNVREWCWDWYSDCPTSPQTNPSGAAQGTHRVVRGGCWLYFARSCRAAYRYFVVPENWYSSLGFRVARSSRG